MKHIGFTGTRMGMTERQMSAVRDLLLELQPTHVHHGDCIGADAEFHSIARSLGITIIGHPPDDRRYRAFCAFDEIRAPKPYLDRNIDIVTEGDFGLIAAPMENVEQQRGGTWSTVRKGRVYRRTIHFAWRNGRTLTEAPLDAQYGPEHPRLTRLYVDGVATKYTRRQ